MYKTGFTPVQAPVISVPKAPEGRRSPPSAAGNPVQVSHAPPATKLEQTVTTPGAAKPVEVNAVASKSPDTSTAKPKR